MGLFVGLASMVGLSLFLSWVLGRSSALMPFVSAGCAMVFFTVAGVLGFLQVAGVVWYLLCAVAFVVVAAVKRKKLVALVSPGLVFFALGSVVFIGLFLLTQPMLSHWDEFTFWGSAAKATGQSGLLYTTAPRNLIARAYPPGLIVFSYMMQFFVSGGYSEPTLIASFAILQLACLAAPMAVWVKNKTTATIMGGAMFLLPFLFSLNGGGGHMQWSYLVCMADVPMGLFFGALLCLYFADGEGLGKFSSRSHESAKTAEGSTGKGGRLMLAFGICLAALVCIKDMGLALALIALFVVGCDLLFCQGRKVGFHKLRRGWALGANVAVCLALIAGAYLLWGWHMGAATGDNRFDLGSGGQSLGQVQMLQTGVRMLLGIGRSEQFGQVLSLMGRAFFTRPVALVGSCAVVLGVILAITALAWALSASRLMRRQVVVFTASMAACFAAFYLFNIFTYGLIFKPQEALVLKDYQRYIGPFLMAWLMAALLFLCRTTQSPLATFRRLRTARAASMAVCVCLMVATALLGNWQANFLRVSPAYYQARRSTQRVMDDARAEGMQPADKVYLLSQGDDGGRFYLFGYEMEATRALVFNGLLTDITGQLILDEAGKPRFSGNVAATLVAHDATDATGPYPVACSRMDLMVFLRQEEATHLLVDVLDDYVLAEFGTMFADGLAGWDPATPNAVGHRYYAIQWNRGGGCTFVPATLAGERGAA